MSDLIEKVARAIVSANDADPDFIHGGAPIWGVYTQEARAAILAVAEWLDEQPLETGHETYDMATAKLFRELERLRGEK